MIELTVNGEKRQVDVVPEMPLLWVLRDELGITGPKYGCGYGECGACSVLVDGQAARACVMTLGAVARRQVTTLEGLGTPEAPHPVQRAFIEEEGAQCGYCLNGMIVTVTALLRDTPTPDCATLARALRHNLCRCGTHLEILRAAERAVELMAEARR